MCQRKVHELTASSLESSNSIDPDPNVVSVRLKSNANDKGFQVLARERLPFVSRIVKRESRMAKKLSGLPAGAEAVS
jgi:hypothetical protein